MTAKILRAEAVFQDLNELAKFIQRDSPDAAIRFLDATEKSFQFLAAMPELGERQDFERKELAELRVWQVRGFENYLIFYRTVEQGIEVVRVLHAARDIAAVFDDSSA
jgi:toxin ParE1/3/4